MNAAATKKNSTGKSALAWSKPTGDSVESLHRWTFLTNHAHVLAVLHSDPELVLRKGCSERRYHGAGRSTDSPRPRRQWVYSAGKSGTPEPVPSADKTITSLPNRSAPKDRRLTQTHQQKVDAGCPGLCPQNRRRAFLGEVSGARPSFVGCRRRDLLGHGDCEAAGLALAVKRP